MAILQTLPVSRRERRERLEILLEELKISHLAKQRAYTLSGGERRRLEITRALVTNPSLILLDEPFSGVDPLAVSDIQEGIHQLVQYDIGVLITDHNVRETLDVCDRAYVIKSGSLLASGTSDEIGQNEDVRKHYLGESFKL